jgi:hypothetical protein
MTLFDLVFALTALITAGTLIRACYLLARCRRRLAGRLLLRLCAFLGAYMLVLVIVSLDSGQRVLGIRQPRCFDDWCLEAEQLIWQPAVGRPPLVAVAHGRYAVVTVRVLSRAMRVSQRALDASIYLLDADGRRYDPDAAAQRALNAEGAGGLPLDSELAPGGSFTRTVAFDLPARPSRLDLVVEHGLFPSRFVIGDAQSFLHKPTVIRLSGS